MVAQRETSAQPSTDPPELAPRHRGEQPALGVAPPAQEYAGPAAATVASTEAVASGRPQAVWFTAAFWASASDGNRCRNPNRTDALSTGRYRHRSLAPSSAGSTPRNAISSIRTVPSWILTSASHMSCPTPWELIRPSWNGNRPPRPVIRSSWATCAHTRVLGRQRNPGLEPNMCSLAAPARAECGATGCGQRSGSARETPVVQVAASCRLDGGWKLRSSGGRGPQLFYGKF